MGGSEDVSAGAQGDLPVGRLPDNSERLARVGGAARPFATPSLPTPYPRSARVRTADDRSRLSVPGWVETSNGCLAGSRCGAVPVEVVFELSGRKGVDHAVPAACSSPGGFRLEVSTPPPTRSRQCSCALPCLPPANVHEGACSSRSGSLTATCYLIVQPTQDRNLKGEERREEPR